MQPDENVVEKLRMLTAELPGCFMESGKIVYEHRFREDLGLDSLAMVDLMVAVEDTFQVYFDPIQMDLDKVFESIGSLAEFILNLKSDKE